MAFEPIELAAAEMEDHLRELVSLARLVTYARNNAKNLKVEFPTYCLDLALGSLVEELTKYGMSDMPRRRS